MAAAYERVGEQGVQLEVVADAGEPEQIAGGAGPVEDDERFVVQHLERVGEAPQLLAGRLLDGGEQPQQLTPATTRRLLVQPGAYGLRVQPRPYRLSVQPGAYRPVVQEGDRRHLPLAQRPPAHRRLEPGPPDDLLARLPVVRDRERATPGRRPRLAERHGALKCRPQPGQYARGAALGVGAALDAGPDEYGDDRAGAGRNLFQYGGEARATGEQLGLLGPPEGLLQPDERLAGPFRVLGHHRSLEVRDRSPETGLAEYHSVTLSTPLRGR